MFLDRFSYNVSIETEAEACFGIAHHRRWRRIWTTNLRPPRVRWVLPRLCSGAEFPMIWMGNSSINEGMSIAIFDYLRARLSIARVFILLPERCWKRSQSHSQNLCTIYPLVIEHSHGKWRIYRWFTYWKWWFFMAMLNNQRVCIYIYMSIVHCSDMPRPRRGMSCSPTTFSLYMSTLPILNSNWQGL